MKWHGLPKAEVWNKEIYEICKYNQMLSYFYWLLSKNECGLPQGYIAKTFLLAMIKKWKQSLGNEGQNGALMPGLSKALDLYNILIAKIEAYGFDYLVLAFICRSKQK